MLTVIALSNEEIAGASSYIRQGNSNWWGLNFNVESNSTKNFREIHKECLRQVDRYMILKHAPHVEMHCNLNATLLPPLHWSCHIDNTVAGRFVSREVEPNKNSKTLVPHQVHSSCDWQQTVGGSLANRQSTIDYRTHPLYTVDYK